MNKIILISILSVFPLIGFSQQNQLLTLEEITHMAMENNAHIKALELQTQQSETLKSTAFDLDKTEIYFNKDQNNLAENNQALTIFGLRQNLNFPTVYGKRRELLSANANYQKSVLNQKQLLLKQQIAMVYYRYQILREKERIYQQIDSLYAMFSKSAQRKFELGESNYLEQLTAQAKHKQILLQTTQNQSETQTELGKLQALVQTENPLEVAKIPVEKLSLSIPENVLSVRGKNLWDEKQNIAEAQWKLQKNMMLPDVNFSVFTGSNSSLSKNYSGFEIGLKIPLFFGSHTSKNKAMRLETEIAKTENQNQLVQMGHRIQNLKTVLSQKETALAYFETEGNPLANEILRMAQNSFQQGEIDYFQYIQSIENAYQIKIEYLNSLDEYNQTLLQLHYLTFNEIN